MKWPDLLARTVAYEHSMAPPYFTNCPMASGAHTSWGAGAIRAAMPKLNTAGDDTPRNEATAVSKSHLIHWSSTGKSPQVIGLSTRNPQPVYGLVTSVLFAETHERSGVV